MGDVSDLDEWRRRRRPDPKPVKRHRESGVGMEVVKRLGRCQLCDARTLALDPHHLVPRSQGGDDVVENFAPLCTWSCHRLITENDLYSLIELRARLRADQVAYIVARKGAAWLDRRYPEN